MSTNNFANGNFAFGDFPRVAAGVGVRLPFGTLLPPATRTVYVRSTGPQDGDDPTLAKRLFLTLAAALTQCRAGLGDTVVVLPGHTENVVDATMLDNLTNGTRIIGMGNPMQDDAPTFRWTATASQWVVDNKNVVIAGLRLRCEGANGVVKAINITGSGVTLANNNIEVASGAALKATIAIEVGSGATDCLISNNYMHGTETHNVTDLIKVVGATLPNRLTIAENTIIASATAANGLIHITVAALRVLLKNNVLYNTHTASSATIAVDAVAADGIFSGNLSGVMNDATASSQGIVFAGTALVKCFQNFTADQPRISGLLGPVAAT